MSKVDNFNVFISYRHKENFYLELVVQVLKDIEGVSPFIDKQDIGYGDEIHVKIVKMLMETHCMVAIITKESIESKEVFEEWVRADAMGIPIIPLLHKEVDINKLPTFLRDINHIELDEKHIENVKRELKQTLGSKKDEVEANEHLKKLKSIYDKANNIVANAKELKISLLNDLLSNMEEEMEEILNMQYKMNIGIEQNFLLRANPIFRSANKIYAVSIDSISTFWTYLRKRGIAKSYIDSQPPSTHRLFVFTSADNAHKHLNLLNAHYNHYGEKDGNVFICSLESYKKIVNDIILIDEDNNMKNNFLQKDFGILQYKSINNKEDYFIEATLDKHFLSFKEIRIKNGRRKNNLVDYKKFINIFEKLGNLKGGEIDEEYNILKWSDKIIPDGKWSSNLKNLFIHRNGHIYHMVFFKEENKKLRELVLKTKYRLMQEKDNNGDNIFPFESIWFGARIFLKVSDGTYKGVIDTGEESELPYVLIMKFSDENKLKIYYENEKHSEIRRNLLENWDDIKELYEQIDSKTQIREIREIYEEIEEKASSYMIRQDYIDDEDIDYIIETEPIKF